MTDDRPGNIRISYLPPITDAEVEELARKIRESFKRRSSAAGAVWVLERRARRPKPTPAPEPWWHSLGRAAAWLTLLALLRAARVVFVARG